MKKDIMIVAIFVMGLIIASSTGAVNTINPEISKQVYIYEKTAGICGEKAIKLDITCHPIQTEVIRLATDIQITSSEFDESHPVFDIDYNGNPFLLYHVREDLFSSKIFMQRSPDGGKTWPDDLALYWEWEDECAINPDINFVDGIRAFGVHELAGQAPILYFYDCVNIDDPDSWTVYYFDRSGAASYVAETAVAANKSGRIALSSIQDYQGDEYYEDTLLITWDANNLDDDTADGGVYWLNRDGDGNSIPYSNLCADAGDKIFFVFQRDPLNGKSQIASAYCKVDEMTLYSDWKQSSVAISSQYNCTFPDLSVSGKMVYVAYMSDENGNKDIYVSTTTTGSFWRKYQVTDTPDDEMYPVISGRGNEATCLFMKNGDLYKTVTEDAGKTWGTPELVNDVSNTVVEDFQYSDVEGSYGIWTDNRNGNNDIYFEEVGLAPILAIDEIKGGFGVQVTISNVGNAPAEDVDWSIDIEDGILLLGSHAEGLETLSAGSSKTVTSGFVFGFGHVSILATFGDATKTASGFCLGPFVLDVK